MNRGGKYALSIKKIELNIIPIPKLIKRDGIITPKAFEPLSVKLKFRDANDLSYIKAAK